MKMVNHLLDRPRYLLAFAFVALVICSVPVFGSRFLNDMDFYALFADKLLSGGIPYRDAMDTKPPLVFLHYAAVFKVFGLNNAIAIKVVTMAWLGLQSVLVVVIRRSLSPAAARPMLVAPLFVLASFCGWGEEFLSSNTELLANLFILAGVAMLVAEDFAARPLQLVMGGTCLGIAFLYRYQSIAPLVGYLGTIAVKFGEFDRKAQRLVFLGAGFCLPIALLVAYYARVGALSDLRLMVALQAHYARDADDLHLPTLLGRALVAMGGLSPLIVLAMMSAAAIVRKPWSASRSQIFQVMFAGFSFATFFAGARLFPHYFVQAIPGLVLLAAERLDPALPQSTPPRNSTWSRVNAAALAVIVAVAAVFTVVNGVYYWTRKDKQTNRDLVAFVEASSLPTDPVLLWTWRPRLLFDTGRVFATRLLVNSPLIGQLEPPPSTPRARLRRSGLPELWPAYLRDLAAAPPRLIVDDPPGESDWRMARYPQFASLLARYYPCRIVDDVCIYVRRE